MKEALFPIHGISKNRQAQGYSRFIKPSYGLTFGFGNSQALKMS
jgi:hypothetical protein